jgi:hypothetical protein
VSKAAEGQPAITPVPPLLNELQNTDGTSSLKEH